MSKKIFYKKGLFTPLSVSFTKFVSLSRTWVRRKKDVTAALNLKVFGLHSPAAECRN